jgi:hypothetical protein
VHEKNTTNTARNNIIIRGVTNEWYLLETIDGVNYRWGLWLNSPVIPAVQLYGLVRWRSTRAERYAELCTVKILERITTNRTRLIVGNFADFAPQDTSSSGISEAVEDAIYHAIANEVNSIRPSTYEKAMDLVQDSDLITGTINTTLTRIVGPTVGISAEVSLPRLHRFNSTNTNFLRTYSERWRTEPYDPQQYSASSEESRVVFLNVVKVIVHKSIADMTKNNSWDVYLTSLKDYASDNI